MKLDIGNLEVRTGYGPADLDIGKSGEIALVATTSQHPTELYWLDSMRGQPRKLTNYNAGIAALDLGRSKEIRWQSDDGLQANGILTYPPDFDANRRYPLVLKIHGDAAASAAISSVQRERSLWWK